MPTKIEWCEETWNPIAGCTGLTAGLIASAAAQIYKIGRKDGKDAESTS